MLETVRSFVAGCGIGGLLLLAGSVLLFSAPLPRTWGAAKDWIQKPRALAGMICLVCSLIFALSGCLALLH